MNYATTSNHTQAAPTKLGPSRVYEYSLQNMGVNKFNHESNTTHAALKSSGRGQIMNTVGAPQGAWTPPYVGAAHPESVANLQALTRGRGRDMNSRSSECGFDCTFENKNIILDKLVLFFSACTCNICVYLVSLFTAPPGLEPPTEIKQLAADNITMVKQAAASCNSSGYVSPYAPSPVRDLSDTDSVSSSLSSHSDSRPPRSIGRGRVVGRGSSPVGNTRKGRVANRVNAPGPAPFSGKGGVVNQSNPSVTSIGRGVWDPQAVEREVSPPVVGRRATVPPTYGTGNKYTSDRGPSPEGEQATLKSNLVTGVEVPPATDRNDPFTSSVLPMAGVGRGRMRSGIGRGTRPPGITPAAPIGRGRAEPDTVLRTPAFYMSGMPSAAEPAFIVPSVGGTDVASMYYIMY